MILYVACLFYMLVVNEVNGANNECMNARGQVKCGDQQQHDGKVVFIHLVDGSKKVIDEGYTTKNGRFAVAGCTSNRASSEVHILHRCKRNEPRRVVIQLPDSSNKDFNFTQVINLKVDNPGEGPFEFNIEEPCDTVD